MYEISLLIEYTNHTTWFNSWLIHCYILFPTTNYHVLTCNLIFFIVILASTYLNRFWHFVIYYKLFTHVHDTFYSNLTAIAVVSLIIVLVMIFPAVSPAGQSCIITIGVDDGLLVLVRNCCFMIFFVCCCLTGDCYLNHTPNIGTIYAQWALWASL